MTGYQKPTWPHIWSLVMLTMALIVVVVLVTEDPPTAVVTVLAGLALALALH